MGYLLITEPEENFDFGIKFWWFDNSNLTSIELFVASCLIDFIISEILKLYFFRHNNPGFDTIFSVFRVLIVI